jgi:hypothetical protein
MAAYCRSRGGKLDGRHRNITGGMDNSKTLERSELVFEVLVANTIAITPEIIPFLEFRR